ncbi:MAG TPA: SH3 domain-containing protein [Oscillospiraceae bacterium]|nr:SH3 domain-containing protein [Oscillospiraceae bacterium]HRW57410.1 SH3 domain-containing protein [Oscillospiraceae bacterium]
MKRILPWILALVFLLGGCSQTEVTPEPESSAAETEASSGAVEDLPPEVTGPDENGVFPSISCEDFDRWVTDNGPPDVEKPDDGEITPFLETESCQKYLAENFGGIVGEIGDIGDLSDWRVLFEDDHYVLQTGMYDPYTYTWRDQWMPLRFVMLGSDTSGTYDRLAFVCIDLYSVYAGSGDFFVPQEESLIYWGFGRESELQFGTEEDYAAAQTYFRLENDYYPSLVNSTTGRTVLIDYSVRDEMIAVREIPENFGHTVFYSEKLESYKMSGVPDDRIVYLYRDNDLDDRIDVAYYDASTQELHPLAYGGNWFYSPQFSVLSTGAFAITGGEADEISIYHTENETPWVPAAVLGGDGKGLSDGGIYLSFQPLTDKKETDLRVLSYISKEDQLLYFCTFRDDGTIVENLSSGLRATADYWPLDLQNFNDGIVYFLYYPDGGASGGTHLAMNLSSGKCHALQIWKQESPFTCTAEGGLNIRSGPGADYEKLGIIPENAEAIVLQETNGWGYVVYGDIVGWASMEYLIQA